MISDVTDLLACPHCASGMDFDDVDRVLICEKGHPFDVARQGYVNLRGGDEGKLTGDSTDMVDARASFLGAGHFDRLIEGVVSACSASAASLASENARVLDIGAGTGHYLAAVLDALPESRGIGLDISKAAARRLARCHPRVGAVAADVWRTLPVQTGALSLVTCIFSPRNAAELHRVLEPGGLLVIVTPTDRHLQELVERLGMVKIDENKTQRLGDSLSGHFERVDRASVEYVMELDPAEVEQVVGMGPSARHSVPDRAAAISELPDRFQVTASVTIGSYRRLANAAS